MEDHASYPEDRIVFRAIRTGVTIGLPLGMLVGALIMWLGQLRAGLAPDPGAIAVAGGYGGLLLGIFFGSVGGVASKSHLLYRDEVAEPPERAIEPAHPHAEAA